MSISASPNARSDSSPGSDSAEAAGAGPATGAGRTLIVANPIAGRGRGERAARALERELAGRGVATDVHFTRARGDGCTAVARRPRDVDRIVSVGGDGTLREVLERPGLDPTHVPVADSAPRDRQRPGAGPPAVEATSHRAADALCSGRSVELDTFEVGGKLAFLVLGVGFDGAAVHVVEERRRGPISKWTYVGAVLRALRSYREPRLSVELDGEPVAGTFGWVLATNVVHYGAIFRLRPDTRSADGRVQVYLFRRASRLALLGHGLRALFGRVPGRGCESRRAAHLRVTAPAPVAAQLDGDHGGATPVELSVARRRFRLLVP